MSRNDDSTKGWGKPVLLHFFFVTSSARSAFSAGRGREVNERARHGGARSNPVGPIALLATAAALAACVQVADWLTPRAPKEWAALVDEIREFERRFGFAETGNFLQFTEQRGSYAFCGAASRLVLPYS